MSALIEMSGRQFERLTVLRRNGSNRYSQAMWLCACSCGKEASVSGFDLRSGHTKSCGCLSLELIASPETKRRIHGMGATPIYKIWTGMISRCTSPRNKCFPSYGGRGITVCPEWFSFECFYADFGHMRPSSEHSMDRRNNDDGYHPGNVRWAVREVQQNNRRDSFNITYMGETLTLTQWSRRTGMSVGGLRHRIERGWPLEMAFSLPPNSGRRIAATPLPTYHQQEKP